MKWFRKLNSFLKVMLIILPLAALIFSYITYKEYELKMAVETYLYEDLGLSEDEVLEVNSTTTQLSGNKFWLAYVKVKGDEKTFIYYKDDNGKVVLESYMYDGVLYGP